MKVAIEPVYDRFGGMYPYVTGIKKYSGHTVREVPSRFTRFFLCRNGWLKTLYHGYMGDSGIRGYDVVHSMSIPWFVDWCRVSASYGRRWVHTYHLFFFEEDYRDGLQPWQVEMNRAQVETASKADVKIATSKWFHDYLLAEHSIETTVVMGGIDVELCAGASAERFRARYGLEDFILFVGSIREVKNPPLFVELAGRMPEKRFVMIGPNLNEADLVKNYGLAVPDNLVLMDRMGRGEVLDAMAACSVFVLTSRHEGFPQVILEAMAVGKTVVSSSYRGVEDLIPGSGYGFVFDKDSADDLADKTRQALAAEGVGERAKKRVAENFDWRVLAKKIDSLYGP